MSLLFCAVNLKGILALFSGVSRWTWRASLATLEEAMKDRDGTREAIRAGRKADRQTKGVILDAIVAVRRRNGLSEDEGIVVVLADN